MSSNVKASFWLMQAGRHLAVVSSEAMPTSVPSLPQDRELECIGRYADKAQADSAAQARLKNFKRLTLV